MTSHVHETYSACARALVWHAQTMDNVVLYYPCPDPYVLRIKCTRSRWPNELLYSSSNYEFGTALLT